MRTGTAATLRCAEHPGRPAHGRCPRCHRPRCDADVAQYAADGCSACRSPGGLVGRSVGLLEALVRAGLAGLPVVWIGGWIATQYVGVHIFSLILPGLIGLSGWLATSRATRAHGTATRWLVTVIAALVGVLGAGLGFRLVPGGQDLLHPLSVVAGPYGCAVLGALAGAMLFPRRDSGSGIRKAAGSR